MNRIVWLVFLFSSMICVVAFSTVQNFYWTRTSTGGTQISVFNPVIVGPGVCVFQGLGESSLKASGEWTYHEDRGGFSSNLGRLFFPAPYVEYSISAIMQFDPEGINHGAYGVFFETGVNDSLQDTGYIAQLDRNSKELLIKRRGNGGDTSGSEWILKRVNLSGVYPDEWWIEEHEMELTVTRVPGTMNQKQLHVRIDDQWLLAGYPIENLILPDMNFTGFWAGEGKTYFMCLTQYVKDTEQDYIPGDETSVLAWYMYQSGRIDNDPPLAKESSQPVIFKAHGTTRIFYPGGAKEGITWKAPSMIFLSGLDLSLPLAMQASFIQFKDRILMNTSGGNTGAAILKPYLPWEDSLIIFDEVLIDNRRVTELSFKAFRFSQEVDLSKRSDWAKLVLVQ